MGTLYWQLNDCWPMASWASIDYFTRWKALHYLAQRFYVPLLISGVEDAAQGTVAVHVTSDLWEPQDGCVVWQITDTEGRVLAEETTPLVIPPQQNTLAVTIDAQPWLAQRSQRKVLVWMALWVNDACASANLATFCRPKHLALHDPHLDVHIHQEQDTQFHVTLTPEKPALWVWVTTQELEARYTITSYTYGQERHSI